MPPPRGSGAASATPDKLIGYAAEMEKAVGAVKIWLSTDLQPIVQAYQHGAIDFGTSAASQAVGLVGTVDGRMTEVGETDNSVGLTGHAFQMVEEQNNPLGLPPYGKLLNPLIAPNGIVTTTDGNLEQAVVQAGVNMARNLGNLTPDQIKAGLALDGFDPSFMYGFLNTLTPYQLRALLDANQGYFGQPQDQGLQDVLIPAIVTAFHAGVVTTTTRDEIGKILSGEPPITAPLLNALALDPVAAKNFAQGMDPSVWHHLLAGGPRWDLNADVQQATLGVLTAAVKGFQQTDQNSTDLRNDVKALLEAAGKDLPVTTAENIDYLKDDIQTLLERAAKAMAGTSPKDAASIHAWLTALGNGSASFDNFYVWMDKSYEASGEDAKFRHEIIATMALEVGIALAPELGPEVLVAANAGWIVPTLVGRINDAWPKGPDPKGDLLREAVTKVMAWTLARELYTNKMILGADGKPLPWDNVPGHDDPEAFYAGIKLADQLIAANPNDKHPEDPAYGRLLGATDPNGDSIVHAIEAFLGAHDLAKQ